MATSKKGVKVVVKEKKRTSVSNVARMDAKNPIPFDYGGNTFSFVHQAAYLPFLPPADTYAQNLLEARLLSATHDACIRTKKDYCAGNGFYDVNGKVLTEEIKTWFRAINIKNQSITKLNKKAFEDKFTFGNVPIEVVRLTVMGKKKLFVYVHNFLEWRLGKPNADDVIEYAVQSKLFLRTGYITGEMLKDSKKLPLYNPQRSEKQNWQRDAKGVERTLIWYKNETSGFPYYGIPSAVSSMIYQLLEYKGARYNLDNFENNMIVASILALKGTLGQEEANRIGKLILNAHTGDGKRGRTMVVASEEGIDGSSLHNMDTQQDGSFVDADEKWSQKIILANNWDAVLAGIIAPSTLGKGSGFLRTILQQKMDSVILPEQNDIVDEVWSLVFGIADSWLGLGLGNYELKIKNTTDITGINDVDIAPAVTRNEVRKARGMAEDPTPAGKEYMISTTASKKKGGEDV